MINDSTSALAYFSAATTRHAEATEAGESTGANSAYRQIINSLQWLKANNAAHLLQPLLAADSAGTRLWAAAYLLASGGTEGELVLMELAAQPTMLGHSADMTLHEWRAGRLQPLV